MNKFELTHSPKKFGLIESDSGSFWNLYWSTRLPYFALPTTGLSLVVGESVTIYGDSLISVLVGSDLSVTYTCDIGSASGNNYNFIPIAGDIGNHSLRMVFVSNGVTREDKTITVAVYAKEGAGNVGLLMVGDSTLSGESVGIKVDSILSDLIITYLGTQGTTRKNEGRSGFSWQTFATNVTSPFIKAGVLDIAAYFTDNLIADPDIVYFRLGINDLFQYRILDITDANITTILGYVDILVNGFLTYNADLKIILALPTICCDDFTTWVADYVTDIESYQNKYIEIVHKFSSAFITKYAGGVYNARVDCSYERILIDRVNDYTNALHLDASGDINLGLGLAPYINNRVPYGLELISNGTFTDATGWTLVTHWSVGTGKLNFDGIATEGAYIAATGTATKVYKMSFDVSGVGVDAVIGLLTGFGGTWIFAAPYNTWTHVTNGHYDLILTCTNNFIQFEIYGNSTGALSIDNLSMKEVL